MKSKSIFKLLIVLLALFMSVFCLLGYMSEIDFLKLKSLHLSASAEEINVLSNTNAKKIAIIDTGYRYDSGFNEYQIVDQTNILDGSTNVDDTCGHGSAMLATLLGYSNSEEGIYIQGINPNAEVVIIKVAEGSRTTAEILAQGIRYAVNANVDIINISLGTSVNNEALEEAVNEALSCGIQIVAAVGDSNDSQALYPARYDGVIAVEAQAADGTRYLYSNECDKSIRVPGVNVTTIGYNVAKEEWQQEYISGSSMACIIFSSVLTREEEYEVNYDYLEYCKINDILVMFELSDCTIPFETEVGDGEYYDLLKEEQDTISSLDHEFIVQYGNYVYIENGKYQFNSGLFSEDDEGAEFISYNIDTINELIDEGVAYIDDETYEVLTCDEDVLTQAGANKIKLHWYGIDATLDKSLTYAIAFFSVLVQSFSTAYAKNLVKKAKIESGVLPLIVDKINETLSSDDILNYGYELTSFLTNEWGTVENCLNTLDEILSLVLSVVNAILTLISVGNVVSLIFSALINYVISSFFPSIVSSVVVTIGCFIGFYTSAKISIRWLKGWGTSLSGVH